MTDTLPLALTGFNYAADINTGMRRSAADTQVIQCGGIDIVEFTTTGMSVAGNLDATGDVKSNGVLISLVGEIKAYAGSSAPAGWLLCYGQAISRATYADLFDVIGTSYGSGDGSTTFNVPDLRGRVVAGKDDMGGSAAGRLTSLSMTPGGNVLGAVGGTQARNLSQANLPNVNFPVTIPAGQGLHDHALTNGSQVAVGGGGSFAIGGGSGVSIIPVTVNNNVLPAMSGFAASGGSASALVIVPPTVIVNYIILAMA